MRDELHLMELVDRYLDGAMNAEERKAFEARATANTELRQLIEDQRALREGVSRLPVRAAAAKAYRSYRLGKPGPWIGAVVVIAVIITAAFFALRETPLAFNKEHDSVPSEVVIPEPVVPSVILSDTIGTHIAPLVMFIDPTKDTTMLTPSGVLLDVPKGSFVDSAGKTIVTSVRITMLEAFDAATIMKAGLSTMSGDTLLETGGMFYLDATSQGNKVSIAPGRALNVMIPADGIAVDMLLYDGVMRADSIIDWRKPVPLARTLVPVDIRTLDFYPPGYEAKLAELGQDVRNKAFRDSLYYSMDCSAKNEAAGSTPDSYEIFLAADTLVAPADSFRISANGSSKLCGVDPSKVKAIWNTRFNGTNLATREFEERMRSIHGTCDNAVLDLYVNNLTEDLRTLDRRAAQMGFTNFSAFAKRNDGRVVLPAESAERLKRIYADWSQAYAEASRKAQDTFWNKQRELDRQGQQRAWADQTAEQVARQKLLEAETEANLRSVYAQMGYASVPSWVRPSPQGNDVTASNSPIVLPPTPRSAFSARVSTLGWKNCDVAFSAAYTRRTERVGSSGKRAVITYAPCVVVVPEANSYDVVRVYLMPQEGRAYQRMDAVASGRFQENLNSIYTYDAAVLAQKDGQRYFYEYKSIKGRSALTASLAPVTEQQLTTKLSGYERTSGRGLLDASNYMLAAVKDMKRTRANMDRARLRAALIPVVFPCGERKAAASSPAGMWEEAPDTLPTNIRLQNILTPDGDNVNDRLIIPGGPFRRARLRVSNAAGERLFSSDDVDPSWNGLMSNGTRAAAGTYTATAEAIGMDGRMYAGRETVRLVWPTTGGNERR